LKITPEENDLLLQLVNDNTLPDLDTSKHVTPEMLANQIDKCTNAARHILEKRRKAGEIEREKVRLPNGRWSWGYFIK
jgi:predicted transcriptional regulator